MSDDDRIDLVELYNAPDHHGGVHGGDEFIAQMLISAREQGFDIIPFEKDGKKQYTIVKKVEGDEVAFNPILEGDWIMGFPLLDDARIGRRKEIIDEILCWAENNGLLTEEDDGQKEDRRGITFIGTEDDRHMFADAILGTVDKPHSAVVYLRSKVIEAHMEMGSGDYEEAMEWHEYNTVRGLDYIPAKEGPPIIVDDLIC